MEWQNQASRSPLDESISLHVRIDEAFNTVWLSLDQMAELFGRDRSVIGKHVRTIFNEGELQKESVWAKFAYTASDGKTYQVDYYNFVTFLLNSLAVS